MTIIEDIAIRKIVDSRGRPTVEVDIYTDEAYGSAAAPSGASTGTHEVKAFPDNGIDSGIDIFENKLVPQIIGMDSLEQETLDAILHEIDGTSDFSALGGNIAIATSLAAAKAAAHSLDLPFYVYLGGIRSRRMPQPLSNVLGGGAHAVNGTDIQEYLVLPMGQHAQENVFAAAKVHAKVKDMLTAKFPNVSLGKGDEGAWCAPISNVDALDLVKDACEQVSGEVGFKVGMGLDVAASELYKNGKYVYGEQSLSPEEQVTFMLELIENYGLVYLEDPMNEEDFQGFADITKGAKDCLVVGDDLFVTNKERLKKGIEMNSANAILIKPNQIGTLTDMLQTMELAERSGLEMIVSHRSGETTDESIAHIGVGCGCYAIKTGISGGERIAKLNELIRIEEEINPGA